MSVYPSTELKLKEEKWMWENEDEWKAYKRELKARKDSIKREALALRWRLHVGECAVTPGIDNRDYYFICKFHLLHTHTDKRQCESVAVAGIFARSQWPHGRSLGHGVDAVRKKFLLSYFYSL